MQGIEATAERTRNKTTTAFPRPKQSARTKVSNPSHRKLLTYVHCPVRNKCVVNATNSIILFCVWIDIIKEPMTKSLQATIFRRMQRAHQRQR